MTGALPPEDRQRGTRGVVGAEVVDVQELSHLFGGHGFDSPATPKPALQIMTSSR